MLINKILMLCCINKGSIPYQTQAQAQQPQPQPQPQQQTLDPYDKSNANTIPHPVWHGPPQLHLHIPGTGGAMIPQNPGAPGAPALQVGQQGPC